MPNKMKNKITEYNDWYEGTEAVDKVNGLAGDDALLGKGGNDRLNGGDGNDTVDGGQGNDYLYGGNGNDRIFGADGNDHLFGEAGNDMLAGGRGDDHLAGGTGSDELIGGKGSDTLKGGDGNDMLDGGTGADRLEGGYGKDIYIIDGYDDPAPGKLPATKIIDNDFDGGNIIKFTGGLKEKDITLISDTQTGSLIIEYGYTNSPRNLKSSITVPDGSGGKIITEFVFFGGSRKSFENVCKTQTSCTLTTQDTTHETTDFQTADFGLLLTLVTVLFFR